MEAEQNRVYDATTVDPPQPSTADTDAIQLQPNVVYGVSINPDRGDQTTYCESEGPGPSPPQPSTADTDAIQLQPNVVYGVSIEPDK